MDSTLTTRTPSSGRSTHSHENYSTSSAMRQTTHAQLDPVESMRHARVQRTTALTFNKPQNIMTRDNIRNDFESDVINEGFDQAKAFSSVSFPASPKMIPRSGEDTPPETIIGRFGSDESLKQHEASGEVRSPARIRPGGRLEKSNAYTLSLNDPSNNQRERLVNASRHASSPLGQRPTRSGNMTSPTAGSGRAGPSNARGMPPSGPEFFRRHSLNSSAANSLSRDFHGGERIPCRNCEAAFHEVSRRVQYLEEAVAHYQEVAQMFQMGYEDANQRLKRLIRKENKKILEQLKEKELEADERSSAPRSAQRVRFQLERNVVSIFEPNTPMNVSSPKSLLFNQMMAFTGTGSVSPKSSFSAPRRHHKQHVLDESSCATVETEVNASVSNERSMNDTSQEPSAAATALHDYLKNDPQNDLKSTNQFTGPVGIAVVTRRPGEDANIHTDKQTGHAHTVVAQRPNTPAHSGTKPGSSGAISHRLSQRDSSNPTIARNLGIPRNGTNMSRNMSRSMSPLFQDSMTRVVATSPYQMTGQLAAAPRVTARYGGSFKTKRAESPIMKNSSTSSSSVQRSLSAGRATKPMFSSRTVRAGRPEYTVATALHQAKQRAIAPS